MNLNAPLTASAPSSLPSPPWGRRWLKSLNSDKTLIVHAAAQAQKAADFILGHKPERPVEDIIPKISVPPKPAEVVA